MVCLVISISPDIVPVRVTYSGTYRVTNRGTNQDPVIVLVCAPISDTICATISDLVSIPNSDRFI